MKAKDWRVRGEKDCGCDPPGEEAITSFVQLVTTEEYVSSLETLAGQSP